MANGNCTPNIQKTLNDVFRGKPYRSNKGTLDFLFSAANGSQLQAELVGKPNGKNTRYTISYRANNCTAIVACDDVECTDTGTTITPMTTCVVYDGFSCYSSEWQNAEIAVFRDLGSLDAMEVISGAVYDQMQKIKDAIDVAALVAINAGAGYASVTAAYKLLKLIDDNTRAPIWGVDASIKLDFADAGFPDMPILLGNRTIALYKDSVQRGGLNQYGQQLGSIDTLNAFYDVNINDTNTAPNVAGNNVLFAILPQVANIITWSAYTGQFASRVNSINPDKMDIMKMINTDNVTFMHTSLVDPATGMLFDFSIVYDPKCEKFQWRVRSYYRVILLPLIGCKDANFTGIVKYDICSLSDPTCVVVQ